MNSVGPSLLDFSRASAQAADTSRIKVSGQNVGSTKLPAWASTNHAAMTAFVEAMRRELGGVIADATATRLHAILGDDRPLTARLVRESIDEAVRMAQSGLNGRDRFLSDIDPRHGFSAAFDQAVAPLRGKLDDEGLALLRDAAEDDDHYTHYCARRGLKMEPVMEFEYRLLTNRDGPLARHEVKDLAELNHYMQIMHDDFQLPGEDGGDGVRWHVNDIRRIHVYERCSQFSILQQLPSAYMWASPMPQRALDQFHLVLRKCPAQRQVMRDVLVYPDHGALRPEEQAFIDLLHREAALTVK